jgi:hypothetical protein
MLLQEFCDFGKGSRRSYRDHSGSHNVLCGATMRLDVIIRQSVRAGEGSQPPRLALLTNYLCVPYQVAFADDPYNVFLSIDYRHTTDTIRMH